jgi:hypothetical protein
VRLRYIPYSKVQEYARALAARAKGVRPDDAGRLREISAEVQKKQFTESVDSVSGFFVDGREVNDPEFFYEHAPAQLIYEVIGAMEDSAKLGDGQRKNS